MRQQLADIATEVPKAAPAAGLWVGWTVTAEEIYKWLGIIYLTLLILDLVWRRIKAERKDKAAKPEQDEDARKE